MKIYLQLLFCGITLFTFRATAQNKIEYYRDFNKKYNIQSIEKVPFKELANGQINFGKDSSNHWLKIGLSNQENKEGRYYLELNAPWLDSVYFYSSDHSLIKKLSWTTPIKDRLYEHQNFILPITIKPHSDSVFYVKFFKKLMLIGGQIELEKEAIFLSRKTFNHVLYGLYSGIILTIVIFGIFMFMVNREAIYLSYSIYALSNNLFVLTLQGYFLSFYQEGLFYIPANELKDFFLWIDQIAILFFIRQFLWADILIQGWIKWLWRGTLILMASLVFQIIGMAYIYKIHNTVPNGLLLLATFSFFSSVITGFVLVIVAWLRRLNPTATTAYIIGIAPLLLLSIFSYSRNMGLVQNHWLLGEYAQITCVVFDILVLMIGLGFRYRNLRVEKEKQTYLAIENKLKLLQEKERISRDLHDNVGSQLTIISSGIDNAIYLVERHKLLPEKLLQINETVRETVQNLRDSIWATHQNAISIENFQSRLKQYLLKSIGENLAFRVSFEGTSAILSSTLALTLFRIVQEAVQNSLKHARATEILINGRVDEERGKVEIIDNGKGFNTNEALETESYGLSNMKRRIEDLGGILIISSQIGHGTKVSLHFPTK